MEIEVKDYQGMKVMALSGEIDMYSSPALREEMMGLINKRVTPLLVDFKGVSYIDSSGIATFVEGLKGYDVLWWQIKIDRTPRRGKGRYLVFQNWTKSLRYTEPLKMPSIAENFLGLIGRKAISRLQDIHDASKLINDTFYWTFLSPFKGKKIRFRASISEMVKTGYNSVPIVAIISLFVGVILALQAAYQLRRFGALIYVANLVGVSITRELGPILTAIIVAGRSGSAFAAEIGSMKAAEEIDALISMGINPVRFLVVPKLIATDGDASSPNHLF